MSRFEELKQACEEHKYVYILISKGSMQIVRYAWGYSLEDAQTYFRAWLDKECPFLTLEDFFITRVMQNTL